jgi:primase-polymerase (primpol)-like protein
VRVSASKVPLRLDGRPASSTDPAAWCSYQAAKLSAVGIGLGFVLNGDGVACVDLDHCLEGGQLVPWAVELLAMLPGTYIEVSPSGTGLHVWGTGFTGAGRRIRDHRQVEVYGRGRYITVTGERFGGCPSVLGDLSGVLGRVLAA